MMVFMALMIFSILFLMFFFSNLMLYAISLVVLVSVLLFVSNLCGFLHGLTGIMIAVIYIGAMMILIGYVCAVSPNILVEQPMYSKMVFVYLFTLGLFYLMFSSPFQVSFNNSIESMTCFFYSLDGVVMLFVVLFMLFITLLMVTSQYHSPKGPFRSSSEG